jgi:hypothetical protein
VDDGDGDRGSVEQTPQLPQPRGPPERDQPDHGVEREGRREEQVGGPGEGDCACVRHAGDGAGDVPDQPEQGGRGEHAPQRPVTAVREDHRPGQGVATATGSRYTTSPSPGAPPRSPRAAPPGPRRRRARGPLPRRAAARCGCRARSGRPTPDPCAEHRGLRSPTPPQPRAGSRRTGPERHEADLYQVPGLRAADSGFSGRRRVTRGDPEPPGPSVVPPRRADPVSSRC